MTFALQRLRLASFRGVTAVLLKSPIPRNGPKVGPSRGPALPYLALSTRAAFTKSTGDWTSSRQPPCTPVWSMFHYPGWPVVPATVPAFIQTCSLQAAESMPRTSEELGA